MPNVITINSQTDVITIVRSFITEEIIRSLNKALIFRSLKMMAIPMHLRNTIILKIALFEGERFIPMCIGNTHI